jgi:hypothetical protein
MMVKHTNTHKQEISLEEKLNILQDVNKHMGALITMVKQLYQYQLRMPLSETVMSLKTMQNGMNTHRQKQSKQIKITAYFQKT